MRRIALVFFVFLATALAANLKLYLKDGSFQLAREYKVEGNRVHYYSAERSEWEDIPTDLVDLKRTEAEVAETKKSIEAEAKVLSEEDKAERELQNEIMKIPQNPGVYVIEGKETRKFKAAESTVHTNKGRSVLKALSPVPMVTGKATLEIPEAHSLNVLNNGPAGALHSTGEGGALRDHQADAAAQRQDCREDHDHSGDEGNRGGAGGSGDLPQAVDAGWAVQDLAAESAGARGVRGDRVPAGEAEHSGMGLRVQARGGEEPEIAAATDSEPRP